MPFSIGVVPPYVRKLKITQGDDVIYEAFWETNSVAEGEARPTARVLMPCPNFRNPKIFAKKAGRIEVTFSKRMLTPNPPLGGHEIGILGNGGMVQFLLSPVAGTGDTVWEVEFTKADAKAWGAVVGDDVSVGRTVRIQATCEDGWGLDCDPSTVAQPNGAGGFLNHETEPEWDRNHAIRIDTGSGATGAAEPFPQF